MADYQLTETDVVLRTADQVWIPNDPANRDRVEYDKWLADGGVPDPFVAPPAPKPSPSPEDQVLYDHENRIRSLEGAPPLSLADFMGKVKPA
jgi:hypothetical protein